MDYMILIMLFLSGFLNFGSDPFCSQPRTFPPAVTVIDHWVVSNVDQQSAWLQNLTMFGNAPLQHSFG